ncbi:MAG: hypothetical protein JXR97_05740 [Planctomycetes bacterium]|nr:hypothetical protein [Planctomycetota bacterium]
MRALLNRIFELGDSPSVAQDLGTMWSPIRLGFWFILVNLVLGFSLGLTIYLSIIAADGDVMSYSQNLGLGQLCASVFLIGIGNILTILMPIRASGLLEGPRWGRYFDQIVLSGISPLRYFFGKIAAQNIFFLFIIIASLPWAIFSLSLGGTEVSFVIGGMFLLWIYANLITIFTLALGVFLHEIVAVIVVILLFANAYGFLGGMPWPTYISSILTPSHYLLEPVYTHMLNAGNGPPWGDITHFELVLGPFNIQIGSFTFFLFYSAIIGAIALVALLLGPVNCIVKENSTFGAIVLDGDMKKKSLFTKRFNLRRRSEISFFYENRTAFLTRWEGLFRHFGVLLTFTIIVVVACAFLNYYSQQFRQGEYYLASVWIYGIVMFAASLFFCNDRSIELTPQRIGNRSYTSGRLDWFCYTIFCFICILLGCGIPVIRDYLSGSAWYKNGPTRSWDFEMANELRRSVPFIILSFAQFYTMLRYFGTRYWLRAQAIGVSTLLLVALWLAPYGIAVAMMNSFDGIPYVIEIMSWVACLSPIPFMLWFFDSSLSMEGRIILENGPYILGMALHLLLPLLMLNLYKKQVALMEKERKCEVSE